jgi:hypothetical protein
MPYDLVEGLSHDRLNGRSGQHHAQHRQPFADSPGWNRFTADLLANRAG